MELFVCRICGGHVLPCDFDGFGTCDHCGTMQPVPKQNDPNKVKLFTDATNYMLKHQYGKAIQQLLRILTIDAIDPEIYWSIALCRYGIEYVTDPITNERKPTLNRLQSNSFFADPDYQKALSYSNDEQKSYYASCAIQIENARSQAIDIIKFEEPYDVFICYKETDVRTGKRSTDSVLAQNIYSALDEKGLRVFFSRISLENKAGTAYEPYIFAALNSAKVMLVVTTSLDHVNAVWVQNEWSRYSTLIEQGDDKQIIPVYRGISPGELPSEIRSYQGVDMNRPEYLDELVKAIIKRFPEKIRTGNRCSHDVKVNNLLEMAFVHLEMKDWEDAQHKANMALNLEATNPYAFLSLLMADCQIPDQSILGYVPVVISNSRYYEDVLYYGNEELKRIIQKAQKLVDDIYNRAVELVKGDTKGCYDEARALFEKIATYRDSSEYAVQCIQMQKKQSSYYEGLCDYSTIEQANAFVSNKNFRCITDNCYSALKKAIAPLKDSMDYRDAEKLLERIKYEVAKYEIVHEKCNMFSLRDNIQLLSSADEDNTYIINKAKRLLSDKEKSYYREPLRESHPIVFWFLMLALAEVVIGIIVLLITNA